MNLSYRTAIGRKTLPAPVRFLLKENLIHGDILDYGCGRCKALNDKVLAKAPGISSITSYDPFFCPNELLEGELWDYDTILCTYVLCVVSKEVGQSILQTIKILLKTDGVAYITVRNDSPRKGHGVSSKGTLQRKVELPYLEEFKKTSQFRIYRLTKDSVIP